MQDIYAQYAILDAQEKEIKAKKEAMREEILKAMIESGTNSAASDFGKFTVSYVKKWEYPAKVIELGENFKAAKALAESTGDAKFTEEESLRFTPVKL